MPNEHLLLSGVTETYYEAVRELGYLIVADLKADDVVAVEKNFEQVQWPQVLALVNISNQRVAERQPYRTIVIMRNNQVFKIPQTSKMVIRVIERHRLMKLDAHIRGVMAPALGLHRNLPYITNDVCLLPADQQVKSNNSWVHWEPGETHWDFRENGAMLTRVGSVPLLWATSKRAIKKRVRDCQILRDYLFAYSALLCGTKQSVITASEEVSLPDDIEQLSRAAHFNWAKRMLGTMGQEAADDYLALAIKEIEIGDYSGMPEIVGA